MTAEQDSKAFPLWRFSLDRYGRSGVAPICLLLQERFSVDVNVLLFLLWLGQDGQAVRDPGGLDRIEAVIGDWHRDTVVPLRNLRQALKTRPSEVPQMQERLRAKIKTVELDAERMEQLMLQTLRNADPAALSEASENSATALMAANARAYLRWRAPDRAEEADPQLREIAALCSDDGGISG